MVENKNNVTLTENDENTTETSNFIEKFIDEDIAKDGQFEGMAVHTRFPPEPNGYLHIGHAKAVCLNFGIAEKYKGLCNLRMDDTNPVAEDKDFVDQIVSDIHWLGFDWGDRFYYASDYFQAMYEFAIELIKKDLAYVDESSAETIRENRGTLTDPGVESEYRNRPIEESLELFERMRAGEFEDGAMVLRAKIDMSSGNINMRDPVIYRISHTPHHRTGTEWPIYPMYDFAHPIEDALEHITHSLCTMEFEDHRPLYNWVRDNTSVPSKPRQIEFSRLGIEYTVMSKRKLRQLVEEGLVDGWDDPRMPTIAGLRRRGFTPRSIRNFAEGVGITKSQNMIEYSFLESNLRDDLNEHADRRFVVLEPVELEITNYPDDKTEYFSVDNHPDYPERGSRDLPFSKHLWIERDDFMIDPVKKYNRLYVGNKVRLREAYIVECTGFDTDENGNVTKVYATYDEVTKGGKAREGEKVRGTIHWVEKSTALDLEARIYAPLFTVPNPDEAENYKDVINKDSLEVLQAKAEPSLLNTEAEEHFQFMRKGYFTRDNRPENQNKLIFNQSVGLKDTFNRK